MKVSNTIKDIINTIPKDVTIVAATKYSNSDEIKELLNYGINNFGENRVDSFLEKYDSLKDLNIKWHFIGHLQRNKANKIINKIDYLHSLDSLELAKIIDETREEPLNVFAEVSINLEESKNGVPYQNAKEFISKLLNYKNINVIGLMMMSIKASESNSLNDQFSKLRKLRDEIEKELNIKIPNLSMGMSDDYKEAIANGATHVRLGRILFEGYEKY